MKVYVKKGRKVGSAHPKATLTDDQVRKVREMHVPYVVGYKKIAALMGCGESTVRDICQFRTRRNAV